jgi:hypothetical protein
VKENRRRGLDFSHGGGMDPERPFLLKILPSFRKMSEPFAHAPAPPQEAKQDIGGKEQEKGYPKQRIKQSHILRSSLFSIDKLTIKH